MRTVIAALAAVGVAALTVTLWAQDAQAPAKAPEVKAQTTCPVMGGAIDKTLFADHEGKRVYFCCGGCVATFRKDPAKYIKILEDQGVTLEKAPVKDAAAGTGAAAPAAGGEHTHPK